MIDYPPLHDGVRMGKDHVDIFARKIVSLPYLVDGYVQGRILELGTWTGVFADAFVKYGLDVYAIDMRSLCRGMPDSCALTPSPFFQGWRVQSGDRELIPGRSSFFARNY